MRRALLAVSLLVSAMTAAGQSPFLTLKTDLYHFKTLYPRREGSIRANQMVAIIAERLAELGIEFEIQDFDEIEGHHSFGRSLVATIPGRAPDILLICARVDHPPNAELRSDGAVSVALALEIARRAAVETPPLTLRIAFLAAEGSLPGDTQLGTRRLLEDLYPEHPLAVLYLDIARGKSPVALHAGTNQRMAPRWLVQSALRALQGSRFPYALDTRLIELARMASSPERPLSVAPFLERDIPALMLTTSEAAPAVVEDLWYVRFFDFLDRFMEAHAGGFPTTWDAHYLLFRARDRNVIVDETRYVTLMVVIMGLAVAFFRAFRRRITLDLKRSRRHLWLLPLLVGATFLFFLASTALIREVQLVRENSRLWRAAPGLFLALKLTAAVLMMITAHLTVTRVFRAHIEVVSERFFPTAALLLVLLNIFLVALVDIVMTVYFLFPLLLILLYGLVRNPNLRLLFFALALGELALAGLRLFVYPEGTFSRAVLLSPYQGNLILAAVSAPYTVLSLDFSRGVRRLHPFFFRRVLPVTTAAAVVVLVGVALVFPAYGPRNPQPAEAIQLVDRTSELNTIVLTSPAPLGTVSVWSGPQVTTYEVDGSRLEIDGPDPGDLMAFSHTSRGILERENVVLSVRVRGRPDSMTVTVESETRFVLYDSNFPVTRHQDGRLYQIHIGSFPPIPLEVQLTLPRGSAYTVHATGEFREPAGLFRVSGRHLQVSRRLRYTDRTTFGL